MILTFFMNTIAKPHSLKQIRGTSKKQTETKQIKVISGKGHPPFTSKSIVSSFLLISFNLMQVNGSSLWI